MRDTTLEEILARYRPFESRLSGQLAYQPCEISLLELTEPGCELEDLAAVEIPTAVCTPPPSPRDPLTRAFRALWRSTHRSARTSPTAEELRLQAASKLVLSGSDASVATSIAQLEEAYAADPDRTPVMIDLSAAYLHEAGVTDQAELLVKALELAERASALAPDRPEALFNRALARGALGLQHAAMVAWNDYLEVDPTGPWADEARERLGRISPALGHGWGEEARAAIRQAASRRDLEQVQELIAGSYQQAREWAERPLFEEWALAVEGGRTDEAAQAFAALQTIATALSAATGDALLSDAVAAVAAAHAAGGKSLRRLTSGHRLLAEGERALYRDWQPEAAGRRFAAAAVDFAAAGSPFVLWARFYQGLAAYYSNRYGEAEEELRVLEREFPPDRYPVLFARAEWVRGLAVSSLERLQETADHYGAAASTFCRLGEEENRTAAQSLLASTLSMVGRRDRSWAHCYNALTRRSSVLNPVRQHAILEDTLLSARRQGLEWAALAFSDEHLPIARATGGAQILHNAHMWRASILARLGDEERSATEFRRAITAFERLQSPEIRRRADADRAMERGEALVDRDPGAAVTLLSQAVQTFAGSRNFQKLPEAYHLRSLAFLERGDLPEAERDLSEAIRLLDLARQGVLRYPDRAALSRQSRAAFDDMVRLQALVLGRPRSAFRVAEQGRVALASEASATPQGVAPRGMAVERVQERLTPGAALLEVTVLADSTLLWLVTSDGFHHVAVPVAEGQIERLVDAFITGLAGAGDRWREPATRLHGALLAPVKPWLAGKDRLVVVADRALYRLPFEALTEPRTGRLVVQDYTLTYAPSATLWVRLSDVARHSPELEAAAEVPKLAARDPHGGDGGEKGVAQAQRHPALLAVAGIADGSGRLSELPGAAREAGAVAALYRGSRSLDGVRDSAQKLFAELARAEVFHFTGHAERDPPPARTSRLVLADTREKSRFLDAEQLAAAAPHLRLVVLSACSTARGDPGLGDPVGGLVQPFLAAGVPAVIGSLWDVEDGPTEQLLLAFHRRLAAGADPAAALRQAKLELLRRGGPQAQPRDWAAFLLLGLSAD